MIRVSPLLAAAMLLALPAPVAAQDQSRRGFWLEAGGGLASIRVSCSGCTDITRARGTAGYLRLGGVLTRKVALGIESFTYLNEAFGFTEDDDPLVAETATLGAVVLWYPGGSRFFLKGGLGLADGEFTVRAITTQGAEEDEVIEGTGVGISFGLGYDLPIRRWLSLSANAAAYITAIGDLLLPDGRVEDVIPTMYQLSVGITIR